MPRPTALIPPSLGTSDPRGQRRPWPRPSPRPGPLTTDPEEAARLVRSALARAGDDPECRLCGRSRPRAGGRHSWRPHGCDRSPRPGRTDRRAGRVGRACLRGPRQPGLLPAADQGLAGRPARAGPGRGHCGRRGCHGGTAVHATRSGAAGASTAWTRPRQITVVRWTRWWPRGPDPLLEGDILTNRAIVRIARADWRGARKDLDEAARLLHGGRATSARTAMVEHNRGMLETLRGDLPAALVAFDTAADRYRAAGLDPGLLPVERAEALLAAGLAQEALDGCGGGGAPVRLRTATASTWYRRGSPWPRPRCSGATSRWRLARPTWRGSPPGGRVALVGRRWPGTSACVPAGPGQASHPAGLGEARRAAPSWGGGTGRSSAADARLVGARIALDLGSADGGPEGAGGGRARPGGRGPVEMRARAYHAEALLRRTSGDAVGAARSVRAGLRVLDELQAGLGASDLRAHAAAHTSELARLGVELALESGRPRAVLAAAERARATSLRFRSARPPDDEELVGRPGRPPRGRGRDRCGRAARRPR